MKTHVRIPSARLLLGRELPKRRASLRNAQHFGLCFEKSACSAKREMKMKMTGPHSLNRAVKAGKNTRTVP